MPCIYVLAGTNGAGKSSIMGAMFLEQGVEYFNPDTAARRVLSTNPGLSQAEANSLAWYEGKRLLERAIAEKLNFAFETTLGGKTIPALLAKALSEGMQVRIWYVGLSSAELHISRVRSRVEQGGHDIPEEAIRQRYTQSRLNLIRLLPKLTELLLYDNSEEADPKAGEMPEPRLILHLVQDKVPRLCDLSQVPEWAKPIVAAAMKLRRFEPEHS
ncbi:MAG TPA: zeta toxin family protein [Candidatus Angelobacter sp.]|nr:zeta toxin family protein [Candidatus Angelobacter sp.]